MKLAHIEMLNAISLSPVSVMLLLVVVGEQH
jgi:hypothetical protein